MAESTSRYPEEITAGSSYHPQDRESEWTGNAAGATCAQPPLAPTFPPQFSECTH